MTKKDVNYTTIEFTNLQGSSIDKYGISQRIYASKAQKYKTYDTLEDLNASFKEGNITHTLRAQKARFEDNILYLQKAVHYENNSSIAINSDKLEYNTKTKIAKSPDTFKLISPQGIMIGDSFVYDLNNRKIQGEKMHYILEVDE